MYLHKIDCKATTILNDLPITGKDFKPRLYKNGNKRYGFKHESLQFILSAWLLDFSYFFCCPELHITQRLKLAEILVSHFLNTVDFARGICASK